MACAQYSRSLGRSARGGYVTALTLANAAPCPKVTAKQDREYFMSVDNVDELRRAFQAFVEARSDLLDVGTDACMQKGLYPNMRNIWQTILMEIFGMQAGEKAMDLSAGLAQMAEDHMKKANLGIQFDDQ